LVEILTYHGFGDAILVSSLLSDGLQINTVQGGFVTVSVGDAGIFFNEAQVVQADILANNGVVHKVDSVLDPFGVRRSLRSTSWDSMNVRILYAYTSPVRSDDYDLPRSSYTYFTKCNRLLMFIEIFCVPVGPSKRMPKELSKRQSYVRALKVAALLDS
jgi:hypothetical protein